MSLKVDACEARDKILFGEAVDWKKRGGGGTEHFENLTFENLEKLFTLGVIDPEDTQNDSPTMQEYREVMKKNPCFTAHGYAVSPEREDYRVTIEGLDGENMTEDQLQMFIEGFRYADTFSVNLKKKTAHCWYD